MTWLTKSEFLQINTVADRLVAELKSNSWNPPAGIRPATSALRTSRLKNATVSFRTIFDTYHKVSLIKGNSNIEIIIPNVGYNKFSATKHIPYIRRMIYGVLTHEFVHVAQRAVAPCQFAAAATLERRLKGISSPTFADKFDLYVGQPLEQEARAHQAVAEVFDEFGTGLKQADFYAAWMKTQLCARTEILIGCRTSASQNMDAWWITTQALSWDIYQTL